jgi:hypothetical protein
MCHQLLAHVTWGESLAMGGQTRAVTFCGGRGCGSARPCCMLQAIPLTSAILDVIPYQRSSHHLSHQVFKLPT